MNAKPPRRRRMTESQLLAVIEDAALGGSWNAAAWLVERRWPERWSKSKTPSAPEQAPEEAPDEDRIAKVIEIAKRRPR